MDNHDRPGVATSLRVTRDREQRCDPGPGTCQQQWRGGITGQVEALASGDADAEFRARPGGGEPARRNLTFVAAVSSRAVRPVDLIATIADPEPATAALTIRR